jgi:hypothetical protein
MTAGTRRRLMIALVAVALTVPIEMLFFQAVSATSEDQIQAWVESLSDEELAQAADDVRLYPVSYRRAIMRALTPAGRSEVWRDHIARYRDQTGTDSVAVPVLDAAIALASPSAFANPTDDLRTQIAIVAEQLVAIVGREDAEYVLYRLGPRDDTFASIEPLWHKMANQVRGLMVALARDGDCQCNLDFGCEAGPNCTDSISCEPVTEWPMCGWFWNEECNGVCSLFGEGL